MSAHLKPIFPVILVCLVLTLACSVFSPSGTSPALTSTPAESPTPLLSRASAIPEDAHKTTPDEDVYPPVIHLPGYQQPVPMPGPVNTAGGEDSPFMAPDGGMFLFFFTPAVSVPAQQQLTDGVTGIWWSLPEGDGWTEPQRAVLNDDLALDGCPFYQDGTLWFCSVRAGTLREIDFYTARFTGAGWADWQNAGAQLNLDLGVGELHIRADGNWMVFHQVDPETGNMDLFSSERTAEGWSEPVSLGAPINTEQIEGWPYLSPDGSELWFTRPSSMGYPGPAIWRSFRSGDGWGEPQEIISSFAGESTMDPAGNIYFTHHFYSADGQMLEADIYVSYRQ
jgi:hypothetical protein